MITLDSHEDTVRERKLILMSIKPCYWERIQEGSKRFELRRTPVRCHPGDLVLVYASSPFKALVGAFEVDRVIRDAKRNVWRTLAPDLGIDRDSYFRYFEGAELATAIQVRRTLTFERLSLSTLRLKWPTFRPPQSFMYWHESHLRDLDLSMSLPLCS